MKLRTLVAVFALATLTACAHKMPYNTISLESSIRHRISQIDTGQIAVSFIDIATNKEIHVGAPQAFHAASTMKVPVLMELYHQAEKGVHSLDEPITVRNVFQSIADTSHYSLSADDDSDSTLYKLVGQKVTAREMARLMITRSSNLATNNLIDLVGASNVRATVARVGANGMTVMRGVEDIPAYRKGMNNTTTSAGLARSLAAIARCEHFTKKSCEEMLDILSAQEFNEMIPAGLPARTRVAHKTGWITGIDHDGAIVFPPHRKPYVLVILTKDVKNAREVGADISRTVWEALTH